MLEDDSTTDDSGGILAQLAIDKEFQTLVAKDHVGILPSTLHRRYQQQPTSPGRSIGADEHQQAKPQYGSSARSERFNKSPPNSTAPQLQRQQQQQARVGSAARSALRAAQWVYEESDPVLPRELLTHELPLEQAQQYQLLHAAMHSPKMRKGQQQQDQDEDDDQEETPREQPTATRLRELQLAADLSCSSPNNARGHWKKRPVSSRLGVSRQSPQRRSRGTRTLDDDSSDDGANVADCCTFGRQQFSETNGVGAVTNNNAAAQQRQRERDEEELIETAPIWARLTDAGHVTRGKELISPFVNTRGRRKRGETGSPVQRVATDDEQLDKFDMEARKLWKALHDFDDASRHGKGTSDGDDGRQQAEDDRKIRERFLPPAAFDTYKIKEFVARNVQHADECVEKMEDAARRVKPLEELREQSMQKCVDSIITAIGRFNDPAYDEYESTDDDDDINKQREKAKEKQRRLDEQETEKAKKSSEAARDDESGAGRRKKREEGAAFGAIGGALASRDDAPLFDSNYAEIMDFCDQIKSIRSSKRKKRSVSSRSQSVASDRQSIVWSDDDDDSIDESEYTLENMLRPAKSFDQQQLEKEERELAEAALGRKKGGQDRGVRMKQLKGKNWKALTNVMRANVAVKETNGKQRPQISRETEASRERKQLQEKAEKERQQYLDSLREAAAAGSFSERTALGYKPIKTEYLGAHRRSFASSETVDDETLSEDSGEGFVNPLKSNRGRRNIRQRRASASAAASSAASDTEATPQTDRLCSRRPSVNSLAAGIADQIVKSRQTSALNTPTNASLQAARERAANEFDDNSDFLSSDVSLVDLPRYRVGHSNVFFVLHMKPQNVEKPHHATRVDIELQNDMSRPAFVSFDLTESTNLIVYPRSGQEFDYMQICAEVPAFGKLLVARLVPFSRMDRWDPIIGSTHIRNPDDIAEVKARAQQFLDAPKRNKSLAHKLRSDMLATVAATALAKKSSQQVPDIFVEGAGEMVQSFIGSDGNEQHQHRKRRKKLATVKIVLSPPGQEGRGDSDDDDDDGPLSRKKKEEREDKQEEERMARFLAERQSLERRQSQLRNKELIQEQLLEDKRRASILSGLMSESNDQNLSRRPSDASSIAAGSPSSPTSSAKKKKKRRSVLSVRSDSLVSRDDSSNPTASRRGSELPPFTPSSPKAATTSEAEMKMKEAGDQRRAGSLSATTPRKGSTPVKQASLESNRRRTTGDAAREAQKHAADHRRKSDPECISFPPGLQPGVSIANEEEEERRIQQLMSQYFEDGDNTTVSNNSDAASPDSGAKMSPHEAAERRRRFYEEQHEINRSHGNFSESNDSLGIDGFGSGRFGEDNEEEDDQNYVWGVSKYQQTTGGVAAARRRASRLPRRIGGDGAPVYSDYDGSSGQHSDAEDEPLNGGGGQGQPRGTREGKARASISDEGHEGMMSRGAAELAQQGRRASEGSKDGKRQDGTIGRTQSGRALTKSSSRSSSSSRGDAFGPAAEAAVEGEQISSARRGSITRAEHPTTQHDTGAQDQGQDQGHEQDQEQSGKRGAAQSPQKKRGAAERSTAGKGPARARAEGTDNERRYYEKSLTAPQGGGFSTSPRPAGLDTGGGFHPSEHAASDFGSNTKGGAIRTSFRRSEEGEGELQPMHEHGDFASAGKRGGQWKAADGGGGRTAADALPEDHPYFQRKFSQPKGGQWKTTSSDRDKQEYRQEQRQYEEKALRQQEQRKHVAEQLRLRIHDKLQSAEAAANNGGGEQKGKHQRPQKQAEQQARTKGKPHLSQEEKSVKVRDATAQQQQRHEFAQNPEAYVDHMDELLGGVVDELTAALQDGEKQQPTKGKQQQDFLPQKKKKSEGELEGGGSGDEKAALRNEALSLIREAQHLARQQRAVAVAVTAASTAKSEKSPFRVATRDVSPQVRWRHSGTEVSQQRQERRQHQQQQVEASTREQRDVGRHEASQEEQREVRSSAVSAQPPSPLSTSPVPRHRDLNDAAIAAQILHGWELQEHREINMVRLLAMLERKTGKRGFVHYFSETDSIYVGLPSSAYSDGDDDEHEENSHYHHHRSARTVGRMSFCSSDGRTGVPMALLVAQSHNSASFEQNALLHPTPPSMSASRLVEGLEVTGGNPKQQQHQQQQLRRGRNARHVRAAHRPTMRTGSFER